MSETTDYTDQTAPGFFKRIKIGDRLKNAYLAWNLNRIANILESIVGTGGIVIRKNKTGDGHGWVIDGSGVTASGTSGIPDGYEEIQGTLFFKEQQVTGTFLVKSNPSGDESTLVKTPYAYTEVKALLQVKDMGNETYKLAIDDGYLRQVT